MERMLDREGLPTSKTLEDYLELSELSDNSLLSNLWEENLLQPLQGFLERPSKHFRSVLVRLGLELGSRKSQSSPYLQEAQAVIEAIHAASLVVDDIQDESDWRRGEPTLHRKVGLAVALNSANWLYFWPFEMMARWDLAADRRLSLARKCHRALIRAHSGQALDVGVCVSKLPQEKVKEVCLASLELKTGALTSLALELGAELGGADPETSRMISKFGIRFGVALQMFDDLGNTREKTPPDPKQFEDLKNNRPSWVWASAAEYLEKDEYSEFLKLVSRLPEKIALQSYLQGAPWMKKASEQACFYLDKALGELKDQMNPSAPLTELEELVEKLKRSYE